MRIKLRIKLWSQAQDASKFKSTVCNKKLRVPILHIGTRNSKIDNADMHVFIWKLFTSFLFHCLEHLDGLLPKEVASVKSILIYQSYHQPQKHKIGKLEYPEKKK